MMKKYLTLALIFATLTQACKKDNKITVDAHVKTLPGGPVAIPELPSDTAPDAGETPPPNEPVTDGFVYRKLNKVTGYNKPMFLDADGNGVPDFTFSSVLLEENDRPYLYLLVSTKSNTGNKVLVQNGPELVINALYTLSFDEGQIIEPTKGNRGKWSEIGQKGFILGVSETASDKQQYGLWVNKADKYLGIQFKIDGGMHYGWVKISHDPEKNELYLAGFAYNTAAGSAIKAGQK